MPKILSANRTNVLINGKAVEGLQEIAYRVVTPHTDIEAIGASERVGVVFGPTRVVGHLRVRSVVDDLEGLLAARSEFQIFASVHAEGSDDVLHEVSLEQCRLSGKQYAMGVGGVGETIYEFTATREQKAGG
jgi:hypothetical protein